MRTPLLSILALTLAAPMAAAAAEPATRSIAVSYGDLDLSSARSAEVLAGRVDRAALRACGASPASVREVRDQTRASGCYQQAVQQAAAQLPAPLATSLR